MGKRAKKQAEKGSKSQKNCSDTGITISQLNDDCVRCILTYLPFKDRLRLQRVSKRWQSLMPWNGQNKLVIKQNNFRLGRKGWMPLSQPVLEKVLCLCGKFLTDIKVAFQDDFSHDNVENYLKLFKNLCPNLVNLGLDNFEPTKPLTEFLIQNFAGLKSFGIGGDFAEGCEKEITNFFIKAENLSKIKFTDSSLRGTCLAALPLASIEKFMVFGSKDMLLGNVCKAFKNMNNLSILQIIDNSLLIDNFDKLLNELPNSSKLETLSLWIIDLSMIHISFERPDREKIVQMKNLCNLTNLQELFLNGPQVVHDEALTIIGNTCTKLKKVLLCDSHKLTDNGWKNFAKLTNIEVLHIGELFTISDKCFDYLQVSLLKNLTCYNIGVTNRSFQALLKSANNLSHLDVALCPQVDCATLIKDVSTQIESRPKYEVFVLEIEIDESTAQIKNISSRLTVKNTNCFLLEIEKKKRQMDSEMNCNG